MPAAPCSPRHDVAEVAGLTSFSFGDDEDSRYVMVFKKVGDGRGRCGELGEVTEPRVTPLPPPGCPQEFAPSDEELEAYRRGEEWDPARAEERRRLRVGGAWWGGV